MNSVASDYLSSADERKKAFTIAPVEQDWGVVILRARKEACEDPDLTDGAKVLFTYLLDLSLQRGSQQRFGVVTISVTKLSERLHRSKRVIYDWNQELTSKRYIWITKAPMPNAWPLNTYHIAARDSQDDARQLPTQDGIWGNGARRSAATPGLGARRMQNLHAENGGSTTSNSSFSEGSAPASGTKEHLSVAESATGSRRSCDGESQNLRLGVAEVATGSRRKEHAAAAQNSTGQPQKPADYKKAIDSRSKLSEAVRKGEEPPPPQEKCFVGNERVWKAFSKVLQDMFPSKLEKMRQKLIAERKTLKESPGVYDFTRSTMKASTADWLRFVDQEITKLETSKENPALLADRKRTRAQALRDPKSYSELALSGEAQHRMEILNRKILMISEVLEGPKD